MLDSDDIKKIGVEVGKVIEHNITPAIDGLRQHVDARLDKVDARLGKVESQMVTKSYLDDKMAELEGGVIVRQRKEDKKVNLLIELLQSKSVLAETDVKQLKEIQVFPTHIE
ncbi:MAG TPA: hypothetical protein DHS36_03705 [Candidatus Veblenbacteria bacterium]|nr:hypothetical protein [Candidatus Veblenbacteria bacterium]